MRCYFMRGGRIEGVTFLKSGPDNEQIEGVTFLKSGPDNEQIEGVTFLKSGPDNAQIEEARSVFAQHAGQQFDGFEVWDGTRFVYRSDVTFHPSGTEGASG
jgi:hypothetical protein